MDIKEAVHSDAAEERSIDTPSIGRRVMAAGLSGAALSLLPWWLSRANATSSTGETSDSTADSTDGSTPTNTSPSSDSTVDTATPTEGSAVVIAAVDTTTTAPPKRPTPEDIELLGFAQSVEIAVVALYDKALESNSLEGAPAEVFNTIRQAHLAYAQSLSGLMGREAPNQINQALYDELEHFFIGSSDQILTAAGSVENTLVATHTALVGELIGLDGSALVASFLVIEARNATVFQTFAGAESLDDQLASNGKPLTPTDYPVE